MSNPWKLCQSLLAFPHIYRRREKPCKRCFATPVKDVLHLSEPPGAKRELKCVRLLDRWGFSQDGTCLWFPVIWYAWSIQWSKCKPPKWECDDDCIAEWLDVAANMSDRVFTPSDSFSFPSYLHTLPSFILTVKSLNLWYPIPFILTASLSLSVSQWALESISY